MSIILCVGLMPVSVFADVETQIGEDESSEWVNSIDIITEEETSEQGDSDVIDDVEETESIYPDDMENTDSETSDPDDMENTDSEISDPVDDISDPYAVMELSETEGVDGTESEPDEEEPEEEDEDGEEDDDVEITLTFEGADYLVTITYGPDAELPEDVVLSAYEYAQDSETYLARLEEAKEICGWDEEDGEITARLFDVILSVDGEKVEPAVPVSVTISYTDQEEMTDYTVIHFGEMTETVSFESSIEDEIQTMSFDLDSFSDIMVLAYEGTSYDVVFTTSNDNGLATDYGGSPLYSGGYNGGNRVTASGDDLAEYADDDGYITISLPANGDLGSEFAIYTDGDTGESVTVTLSNIDSNYNYDLAGWYNLGTGAYYGAGSTATINLSERNVFYADYYAASYDVGYDNGYLANSVSTDFVNIELFDYNELFNLYSTNVTSGANDSGEVFTDSGNLYDSPAVLDDDNTGHAGSATGVSSFITKYNFIGRSNSGDSSYQSNIFYPGGLYDWNEWVDGYNLMNAADTWGITSSSYADNALLNTLFNPYTDALGVKYIGSADYLFQYGTEENGAPSDYIGYYYYSSNYNSAAYNQSEGRFYVYNDVETYSDSNMFLPFQNHDSYQENGSGTNDLNVNYLFGMSMEVNFYLPNAVNGETAVAEGVGNTDVNGNDLVFSYSGDDDILIFVDDTLVLDMSGIHLEADGSINFNTGTWEMSNVTEGPTGTINLAAGNHKLTVYYLERGTGYSNLTVSFNVVPMWYYATDDVQTIEASKVWVDSDNNVVEDTADLPDVSVGLFAALGEGELQSDGSYQYTDDKNQVHTFTYSESEFTHTIDGDIVASSTTKDTDGRFVEDNGWVLAWMDDDGALYVRVDVVSLGESNNWTYDWEMRNPAESYIVLEMEEEEFTLVNTEVNNDITHYYWTIIGETEIENDIVGADLSQVKLVLTDGAQHKTSDETLGDTLEATGWVMVANPDGTISTAEVTFSDIGVLGHVNPDTGEEAADWYGTYGVTTESEINALGDGAVWYLEDAYDVQDDTTGEEIEAFYLYCVIDGTAYYLNLRTNISPATLGVTTDRNNANEFYYDSLGELRVVQSSGDTRIEIDAEGNIILGAASESADSNDMRIYTLTPISENGHGYTFTNLLPEEPVKSVNVGNGTEVGVGSELTYTIAFFNDNNVAATVTITDVLDEGLDFVSATDGGTYDAETRTVTWILENVEALTRSSVSFTAIVNENAIEEGVIPNTATVVIYNEEAVDTNTVENPISEPKDPVKSVDVGDGTTVYVGDELVYTVTYYNHYGEPANVTITDVLDEGIDFVEATDGGVYDDATRTVTWILEDAAALAEGSVSFTVIVNDSALQEGIIPNTADVQIRDNAAIETNTVQNPVDEKEDNSEPNPDTQTGPGPVIDNPNDGNPDNSNPDSSNPNATGTTKTGDNNSVYLWIILMMVAAALVVVGVIIRTGRSKVRR